MSMISNIIYMRLQTSTVAFQVT